MTRCDVLRAVCLLWLGVGLAVAGAHAWTLLPPLLAYGVLAADGALRPGSGWLLPVIRHGNRHNSSVALSFDDSRRWLSLRYNATRRARLSSLSADTPRRIPN